MEAKGRPLDVKYIDLSRCVVDWVMDSHQWHRAVSIDIEADLRTLDDPAKILLSISIARRINGQVEIKKFVLSEETTTDEARILGELGIEFRQNSPLILIGYNNGLFDQPILALKLHQLEDVFKQGRKYQRGYWDLNDAITRSYLLDMMAPVMSEVAEYDKAPWKRLSLEEAIAHPRFKHLAFKRTKHIVSDRLTANSSPTKWDVIHDLWKNDRKLFERYIEGDVHDTFLIAEDIFRSKPVA